MPRINATDLVDVLVYAAVLAIFAELFPEVISESFLVSLLTAVVLKVVLEIVIRLKSAVVARLKGADSARVRVVSVLCLIGVGAGSKALILWLTDLVFGDAVYLGGFFAVTLLVVSLIAARAGVRRIIQ
ncbi:hypothetical protein [Leucobacter luti]|uniref:Uncharacterized protein n=1 Tax=Leucobacter luti TaxID=340320 RepID=A0A4Q7TU77_9MICO|nr:hypothetical protein [Leucobacter luti]MBL3698401.1 hypothetical protein [Leucobacter luti]RZT64511.1 hypothetical protein EV139_1929 [Leucobacter luti]